MTIYRSYPYNVPWKRCQPRHDDWYTSEWPKLSTWCSETYGWGNWEYFNECFRFKKESDKMLFMLRWL